MACNCGLKTICQPYGSKFWTRPIEEMRHAAALGAHNNPFNFDLPPREKNVNDLVNS